MRCTLIVCGAGLLSLLAVQADARGGGSGGHGGGGFHGGFHIGTLHTGFVQHPRFVHNPGIARGVRNQRLANRFPNNQIGFPWGGFWPDWPAGYTFQPVQQVPPPPQPPQIIVIQANGNGRMTMADAAPDVSYVKGCHAIPNGYHCDTP